mmetsp:Transcript_84734/g.236483  ORF Transcript_84734/g.236483 Transcript_84734/m.236483 type:complete len:272 (-) Transcript_84734:731-1546(-)
MRSPFRPAFAAIFRIGATIASATMTAPRSSSSAKFLLAHSRSSRERWQRAVPPPGTMPSSTAAFVALIASSMRNFLSLSSVSVVAPTLIKATPPTSFANRFRSCSLVYSLFVSSIWARIWAQRSSSASLGASATIVVESFFTVTRRASPKSSNCTLSNFRPNSSVRYVAPVTNAISWRMAFRLSPKPGAWIAQQSTMPRSLLRISVARTSFSMVSATMSKGLFTCLASVSMGMSSFCAMETFWFVTSTNGVEASHCLTSGFDASRHKYGET